MRCKHRLAADLGPSRAAAIQRHLAHHTAAVLRQAQERLEMEVLLAVDGAGSGARRRWARQLGLDRVTDQGRGGLGVRLRRQALRNLNAGRSAVLLIGTDLPGLDESDLARAAGLLQEHSLVVGPSGDGGYWLLGIKAAPPWLFAGVPWGSDGVLATTLARASHHGWSVAQLGCRQDLDRRSDMAPWLG